MNRSRKQRAAKPAARRRSATASRQSPRPPAVKASHQLDLSKIRHDLRTPINHILGYCEMLQEDEQLPASFAPDLAKIHAGGRQLLALIAEYFDEETFDTKRGDVQRLCHDLRTPVNQIIGYSEILQEDAEAIGRKKYLPDLRKIRDAASLWLGLMEEHLLPTGGNADAAGVGAEFDGSRILPPGFTFQSPTPGVAVKPRRVQGRLLVVDDDESNRDMLSRRLQRDGYTVQMAANGVEALRLLRASPFDLLLLDLIMPGLDGYQVLLRMKQDPALRGVPVIMLSALDQEEGIARCLEAGAEDYVAKPFRPVFLRARIEASLDKKRLRDLDRVRLVELGRAHELVRRAFGRYVSEEVATSILESPEGLELGGEEREVTILMSDLRGFTALIERLPPQDVITFLNLYLEAMVEVISRYGGTIDEIIGDAILVIFGAPLPRQDHAANAVACALAMQLAMTDVNKRLAAKSGTELEMGIGINTGRVVVGNIGSVRRTKYAAVGTNVNLAGRIESFTTGGQLLISESTRAAIQSPLRLDAEFSVEPKGATRRLQLYEVGGIGEPFNLSLPLRSSPLDQLPAPLPITITVLEEKFLGRTAHEGRLLALSATEAGIECEVALLPLSNLKIELNPVAGASPGGELYAKAIGEVDGFAGQTRIRFTSVSPELKDWLRQATGRRVRGQKTT
jgi:adenylate cyclase